MAKVLAIEWNRSKVRYVLAVPQRRDIKVLAAELIPLEHPPVEEEAPESQVGATLRSALSDEKTTRLPTIVSVGRSAIELFDFTFPTTDERELPGLVINTVIRESAATDDHAIDFAVAKEPNQTSRRVIASSLSPLEQKRIQATCEAAGLVANWILPRSFSATALFFQRAKNPGRPALLINIVDDEADLTFVADSKTLLSRTIRLPAVRTETSIDQRLVSEIRRTLLTNPIFRGGENEGIQIEHAYVFGRVDDYEHLLEKLESDLQLTAEAFDVFGGTKIKADAVPEDTGSFAALIGVLIQHARKVEPPLDFLHPKKPPKPPNHRRTVAIVAGVLLSLVFVGAYHVWSTLADADAENLRLATQLRELEGLKKRAAKKKIVYNALRMWHMESVNWLDELRDITLRLPPKKDVTLRVITASPARGGGSSLTMNGIARSQSVVIKMEQDLRDSHHQVRTPHMEEHIQDKKSTWYFESFVYLKPRSRSEYLGEDAETPASEPEKKPATSRAVAKTASRSSKPIQASKTEKQ